MKNIYKISTVMIVLILVVGAFAASFATQPARAAVGFHISGRNLLDVNNNNFVMRALAYPHAWYAANTNAAIPAIKAKGANAVRVVLTGGRWGNNTASELTTIINLCKTNKLVCLLENQDTTGFGEDGAAYSLTQAVNYWKSVQSALTGQEAYVIINIGNEPYGNTNYTAWTQATKDAIISMRQAGFQHTLMVDAPNWGQDWAFTMRDNAPSVFASDSQANTIFSIHMYGVFDTAAEVNAYVSSFVSRGLPLMIGEFGDNHSDGNPDENAIMSAAQSNGIGYSAWSWSGNGGGVEYLDMVTGFNANSPSAWGNRVFTGANGFSTTSVQCTCYSGINPPTATRTNTPLPGQPTATRTNTPIPGQPTATLTRTPTVGGPTATQPTGGACSPVSATISVPFTKDGTGTFCWQASSLGAYFNSWNLTSLAINGTNYTNVYLASGSYPAKINGFYYVAYSSSVAWGHFEVR